MDVEAARETEAAFWTEGLRCKEASFPAAGVADAFVEGVRCNNACDASGFAVAVVVEGVRCRELGLRVMDGSRSNFDMA